MENTNNTITKKSSNNIIVVVIILIVLIIISIIALKNKKINREVEAPSQANQGLENTINEDTTGKINENINKIDLTDTSTDDLKAVDEELKKL